MKSRFLPFTERDTVLNYYALPLVSLSRKYFGTNFITTKVSSEGKMVFVQLKEDRYEDNVYENKTIINGDFYLYYTVPEIFVEDMCKIIQGQYSKLSYAAKELIIQTSGLMFNVTGPNGTLHTSKLLFALNRDQALIDFFYEHLKSNNKSHNTKLYEALTEVELAEKVETADLF